MNPNTATCSRNHVVVLMTQNQASALAALLFELRSVDPYDGIMIPSNYREELCDLYNQTFGSMS